MIGGTEAQEPPGRGALLRALIASLLLHALAFAALDAPARPATAIIIRARLVRHASPQVPPAPAATAAQIGAATAPGPKPPPARAPSGKSRAPMLLEAETRKPVQPDEAPTLIADSDQLAALRSFRVALALSFSGSAPRDVSCRVNARLTYLRGGAFAALTLSSSDCPADVEAWLRSELISAATATRLPPPLWGLVLEFELPIELEAEQGGRDAP